MAALEQKWWDTVICSLIHQTVDRCCASVEEFHLLTSVCFRHKHMFIVNIPHFVFYIQNKVESLRHFEQVPPLQGLHSRKQERACESADVQWKSETTLSMFGRPPLAQVKQQQQNIKKAVNMFTSAEQWTWNLQTIDTGGKSRHTNLHCNLFTRYGPGTNDGPPSPLD